jgi:hypothetical protein
MINFRPVNEHMSKDIDLAFLDALGAPVAPTTFSAKLYGPTDTLIDELSSQVPTAPTMTLVIPAEDHYCDSGPNEARKLVVEFGYTGTDGEARNFTEEYQYQVVAVAGIAEP